MPIDAKTEPYVLEGRVVTMGPADVVDNGRVYIQGDTIKHVLDRETPPPDAFQNAPVVKTGGTIFPGLIELHNHLSYNAIPLWDVPRQYAHSGSWQGTDEYKAAITKPAQVLANTAGNVEALVRFVECRCLLGGVTTSQGLTLSSKPGITVAYKGLVRNVEKPLVEDLPAAGAKIGAPDKNLDNYLNKLKDHACYLQHLSEGLGATARNQFLRLKRDNGHWALYPSFCGLHCTALTPEDFRILAMDEHGGSIVWSPLSNLLLYGGTTDVNAARDAGLPIALGSDWAPSGTKNILGEMKVARLVCDAQGWSFTDRELCEMVTRTPAEILGWDNKLGTIQSGKLADLIVVNDTTEDPFRQLVKARETSITLVVIDGIPRVGQSRMMNRFGTGTETIKVGSSRRVLDLTPTVAPDPTGGITLTAATDRLRDSLARLPELAEQLDAALDAGWEPYLAFSPSHRAALAYAGVPDDWRPPAFTVDLYFQPEDEARDRSFALASGDLADWVDPMELEGITVADDRGFFTKLARAGNLPQYIKTGLPPLYGQRVPALPPLDAIGSEFEASLKASRELRNTIHDTRLLRAVDRLRIIDEGITLLERHYVHLPMKRAMHAVDTVQRLRMLRLEIEHTDPERLGPDVDFHLAIAEIMNSLRDLHTTYLLPDPYRRQVAWLPFIIEECRCEDGREFIVTLVIGDAGPTTFEKGVKVTHWNGIPMERFVDQLARQMPAGNAAARRARAINMMTIRPLAHGQMPVEDWVSLRYRSAESPSRIFECLHRWLVFEPSRRRRVVVPEDDVGLATALGLDGGTDAIHQVKKLFFAWPLVMAEEAALARGEPLSFSVPEDQVISQMPTHFRARRVRKVGTGGVDYGYLRIFSFNVDDADAFVNEFEQLLGALPDTGLILDVRGNAGGLIHAAERVLELLSPRPIEPQRFQFINSPANLSLCRKHAPSEMFDNFSLEEWIDSMEQSVATAATHSFGFPITDPDDCNRRGQQYQGPVVLIVDGLCYSATDVFAAGFQDHELGSIIGVDTNTGAGGANGWSHGTLRRLAGPESGLRRLPGGADLRVAIRRALRVGPNSGALVEDFGIQIKKPYQLTKDDILKDNCDLIQTAITVLETQPGYRLKLDQQGQQIQVRAENVAWIATTVGRRSLRARDIIAGRTTILLEELPGNGSQTIDVVGMQGEKPVVRARLTVNRN